MADLPAGVITFLLTDIEGSTALWEKYPEAMRKAIRRHDGIMTGTVESNHGFLIKSRGEGDSVFAVFANPANAVASSLKIQLALQREEWEFPEAVRVRMAIHTGEAELRGNDYYGGTVNRCARLRAVAHGGQIVLSGATAGLTGEHLPAGAELRDLGHHRLRDLTEPEHVFQLRHPALPGRFPPLRSLDQHLQNLPIAAVPLVGRERELEVIRDRMLSPDVRLLTLTGPGGIGKTRLGLQAATQLSGQFDDGVYFIGLAVITDPALVIPAIAQALGVREVTGRSLSDVVADFLSGKSVLLVLDNFEQVLQAAPDVAMILGASAGLQILVTSRSVLNVSGEYVYPVPTLSLPKTSSPLSLEELGKSEAIRLFVERAQAAKPDFQLQENNAESVKAICQHLEGLPLGIELAAARTRLLSPQAMVRRLSHALPLLTTGARDVPTRQQTLSAAIGWSYDLLDPAAQALFRRLSVFAGGFSMDAVDVVIGGSSTKLVSPTVVESELPADLLDGVSSLLNASLLEQGEMDDGEPRFRMLEVIREFARDRLHIHNEVDELSDLHAGYFLHLAETAEPHLQGPDQVAWLGRLQTEHNNLRAALARYRDQQDHEQYVRLAGSLFWFWFGHGHWSEALGWYDDALQRCPSRTRWRARALYGAGLLCRARGDHERARNLFNECIEISRELNDAQMIGRALHLLAGVATSRGEVDDARHTLDESLEIAQSIDDGWTIAVVTRDLGALASQAGDHETAQRYLETSVRIHRRRGERWAQAHAQNALGDFLRSRARYDDARSAYEESLHLFSELGTKDGRPSVLHNLAYVELNTADVQGAAAKFQEALGVFHELGDQRGIAECLVGFGGTLTAAGRPRDAARVFGAAETIFETSGTEITPSNQRDYDRNRELAESALGRDGFDRLLEAGRSTSRDETVQGVLSMDVMDFEPPEP